MDGRRRTRVALVNDYEVIVRGVERMLRPFGDRIDVIELDVDQNPDRPVDVALFDSFGNIRLGLDRVESDGYKTLDEGQRVEFNVAPGKKGEEAQNVRVI